MKKSFFGLNKFEISLWAVSMLCISMSFLLFDMSKPLTLVASLVGATALIFLAKGYVMGQLLVIAFALLYAIVSYELKYYGEMITYLGMSAPIAAISAISWFKNRYNDTKEVRVERLSKAKLISTFILSAAVTVIFYFILKALNNASLLVSTLSVFTSFFAASLTVLRSPYYAIGYSFNDIVLIILWAIATFENIANLPMLVCFIVFLINDAYGFINWKRMQKRQAL